MKRLFCIFLVFSILSSFTCAMAEPAPPAPSVSAPSAILMEKSTGQVLYEKDPMRHYCPASVTKIMTMLLIVEDIEAGRLSLEDTVTASARAASFGGSCVFLAEGERMSVSDMLKCIAVVSANDCAVAMAEHISGSEQEFVRRMNQRAAELGLKDTNFTNCTGLFDDENHYTCAYDVALMSRELIGHDMIKNYTTIWMDSIRGGEFELSSTNRLVYWYPGCTGLKTGYTEAAKYCLSATAEREGVEYIAVVMHSDSSDSRNNDAQALLDHAFAYYTLCSLKGAQPPAVRVDMGREDYVPATLGGPDYAVVPKSASEAEYTLSVEKCVSAPVKSGDKLGVLIVRRDGKTLAKLPVLAARDVPRLGFFGILGRLALSLLGV